jgi:hypothetical protein
MNNTFDPNFLNLKDTKVEAIWNGEKIIGVLYFAGVNELHGQYQITLDRTPYWPIDPKTIKSYINDRTSIFR